MGIAVNFWLSPHRQLYSYVALAHYRGFMGLGNHLNSGDYLVGDSGRCKEVFLWRVLDYKLQSEGLEAFL